MTFVRFSDTIINKEKVQVVRKLEKDGDFSICCFFSIDDGIVEHYSTATERDARFEQLCDLFL